MDDVKGTRPIELHIERLVLEGFPASDRRGLGAAVERELARLLTERGLPPGLADTDSARGRLSGGDFGYGGTEPAATVGGRVAEGIYRGLAGGDGRKT